MESWTSAVENFPRILSDNDKDKKECGEQGSSFHDDQIQVLGNSSFSHPNAPTNHKEVLFMSFCILLYMFGQK